MYTRLSDSRTIADEVMAEGTARGDTLLECNIKQRMYDFLAEYGAASTLGGWIVFAEETEHKASCDTMRFIITHRYLRDLFPQDVIDDFARICLLGSENNGYVLTYMELAGTGVLPEDVEAQLPDTIPQELLDYFEARGMDERIGDY